MPVLRRFPSPLVLFISLVFASPSAAETPRDPVLIPTPGIPIVAVRILFETGSADDPAGKEGLCSLAARTVAYGGTDSLTHEEVTKIVFPVAGRIDVQVEKDYVVFIGHVTSEGLEDFYPVFRDVLLRPRWDQGDFDREQESAMSYIENTLVAGDDEELGKNALEAFIYGDGPYGHPIRGTLSSIPSLTMEDAKTFAARHFCRARIFAGVAGDYPEEFPARLFADLEGLPAGEARPPDVPPPAGIEGVELLLVEKNADATALSLGFPVIFDRTHPDYWALLLANQWLGEHRTFYGRLMNVMRVQRGLNYGDYSYIEPFRQDRWTRNPLPNIQRRRQLFTIWIRPVEPENGHFALRQAVHELETFIEKGIPDDEFDDAKEHLRNLSKLWSEGLQRRLGNAMDGVLTGTGDFAERIEAEMAGLTADDVRKALKGHLQAGNMKVAAVCADADSLAEAIRENRASPISYASGAVPEANRDYDAVVEALPLDVRRVEVVPAGEVFREKRVW